LETVTITDVIDVHRRLNDLRLHYVGIRRAVIAGDLAAMSCTPFDAPSAPGYMRWDRTLRGLGEEFSLDGWTREDPYNFSILVSPDRTIAVAVSTGDINTGNPSLPSNTKYPRGPRGQKAIHRNQQFSLFPGVQEEESEDDWLTWFLLVSKQSDDAIQCELKLPWSVGDDGRVQVWAERIVLPAINPNEPIDADAMQPEGDLPDIDIDVARRDKK
jgi:hypothetical protein